MPSALAATTGSLATYVKVHQYEKIMAAQSQMYSDPNLINASSTTYSKSFFLPIYHEGEILNPVPDGKVVPLRQYRTVFLMSFSMTTLKNTSNKP